MNKELSSYLARSKKNREKLVLKSKQILVAIIKENKLKRLPKSSRNLKENVLPPLSVTEQASPINGSSQTLRQKRVLGRIKPSRSFLPTKRGLPKNKPFKKELTISLLNKPILSKRSSCKNC